MPQLSIRFLSVLYKEHTMQPEIFKDFSSLHTVMKWYCYGVGFFLVFLSNIILTMTSIFNVKIQEMKKKGLHNILSLSLA